MIHYLLQSETPHIKVIHYLLQSETPYIKVIQNTTVSPTPIGYPMVYSIIFKAPPQEGVALKFEVESAQEGLFVCGLRIKDIGDNYPCVDRHTQPTYDAQWPSGYNKKGTLDLKYVTNHG